MKNNFIIIAIGLLILVSNAITAQKIYTITASENKIYVGHDKGIAVISDTISQWTEFTKEEYVKKIAINGSNIIIEYDALSKIKFSTDYGVNWQNSDISNIKLSFVRFFVFNGSDVWVGWYGYKEKVFLAVSDNNGSTWKTISGGGLPKEEINDMVITDNTIYVGSKSMYSSTDNGKNWKNCMEKNEEPIRSLAVNGKDILVGTQYDNDRKAELYSYNTINSNWRVLRNNFASTIVVNDSKIYATSKEGVIQSKDNGQTWELINNGIDITTDNSYISDIAFAHSCIYVCTSKGVLYRSGNDGKSWTKVDGAKKLSEIKAAKENKIAIATNKQMAINDSIKNIENKEQIRIFEQQKLVKPIIVHYFNALAELEYGDYDNAQKKLTYTIYTVPNFTQALSARAECYKKLGKTDLEQADRKRVEKIKINPEPNTTAIDTSIFRKEFEAYQKLVNNITSDEHLTHFYKDDIGWYEKGKANYKEKAITAFSKAIEYNPTKAEYYIARGDVYRILSQNNNADADFEKALKLNPKCVKYDKYIGIEQLCTKCYGKGEYEESKSELVEGGGLNSSKLNGISYATSGGRFVTRQVKTTKKCDKCNGRGKIYPREKVKSVKIKE